MLFRKVERKVHKTKRCKNKMEGMKVKMRNGKTINKWSKKKARNHNKKRINKKQTKSSKNKSNLKMTVGLLLKKSELLFSNKFYH